MTNRGVAVAVISSEKWRMTDASIHHHDYYWFFWWIDCCTQDYHSYPHQNSTISDHVSSTAGRTERGCYCLARMNERKRNSQLGL